MVLSDPTRRQLQQLRLLLEEAVARTQQQSEIDRRVAILLLDGACEYAMALALGYKGLRLHDRFGQKYSDLREGMPEWKPNTWTSVRALHEARNLAQHHGASADANLMPIWAAEAQRFVTSLVEAAFGVELTTVLVAEAVEDDDIRRLLLEAERALDQEDAAATFEAVIAAFDRARAVWQGQRAEAIDRVSLQYSGLTSLVSSPETDPVNRSLLRFEDLLEVQPFAPDIAEYHWLVARAGEFKDQIAPNLETARRGFSFVLNWVLRWEAFAVGYEARRYPPPPSPYEAPVTGAGHPVIYSAAVEKLHQIGNWGDDPTLENVRYAVVIALADIPTDEAELWATLVGDVLNEIISERGMEFGSAASVSATGVVRLHGVTAKATGPEIRRWLDESLAEGDKRYRHKLAEHKEVAARLPALRKRLWEAVQSTNPATDIATDTTFEQQQEDGTTWIGVRLRVNGSGDDMLPQVLQNAVIAVIAGRSDVRYFDSTLWFQLDHDPAAAAALIADAAIAYRDRAATRARGLAAVEARRQALQLELSEPESASASIATAPAKHSQPS